MRCDIIIPAWNQMNFTKDCVDSIKKWTKYPFRLILVDNASDRETAAYLDSVNGEKTLFIRNGINQGFVKAVNQGIAASDAPYICVMNNDTLATEGWLEEMVRIAESAKDIGIVNPASNNLGQRPAKGEPIELYANRLKSEKGKYVELGSAIGFCMLIKREVIQRLGGFDEIYGMGNFEDTDFSRRAVKEGYRCVMACGAYVYHRESSSFKMVKTFNEDFERNREIYECRWGKPTRVVYVLDSYDGNILKRVEADSLKLARDGNWVWYYLKDRIDPPLHSNIRVIELSPKFFHVKAIFNILKKKKRFNEIFVGSENLYNVLGKMDFIHKAKVKYY
jgi:GT2 family glycosyltransferase